MAEVHIIGQIIGASGFPEKGLFCKWHLQYGPNWSVISGLQEGQTQIDTPEFNKTCYWCHPIDVHLATKGVQGWPQILVQVYHRDYFGRDELYGYGGTFLPTLPGHHKVVLPCWRPTGSLRQEFVQFFLGGGPALKDINTVYSGNDRSWLQTESMGKVFADIHIIHRNFQKYGFEFTNGPSPGTHQLECTGNDTTCSVTENQIGINETEETTTELYTTTEVAETTTAVKTTLAPMPTLPPALKPSRPSSVCWCDQTGAACDINCCCDAECTISQKLVFTHCSDEEPIHDEKHCYSSNIFYKKPSDVKSFKNQGLFCIVRDNLSTMKEFKQRGPIKNKEEFEKAIRRENQGISRQHTWMPKFSFQPYQAGSFIWAIHKGSLVPFHVITKTFGDLCLTSLPITYLTNVDANCVWKIPRTEPMCSQAVNNFLTKLRVQILTSPLAVNMTDMKSSIENCSNLETCIPLRAYLCKEPKKCSKVDKLVLKPTNCANMGLEMDMKFFHNGTEGIQSASVFIRLLNTTRLKTTVRFLWNGLENEGFVRSGNPGYIRGRPILSGRKILSVANETSEKKEAIEMTTSPEGWLTTFSSENGKCLQNREPIVFGTNLRRSCFLDWDKKYFSKSGCNEMQKNILNILIEENKTNLTNFNKFLGVYGNSRVEVISDWVQILVDYFPLISTQPSFSNSSYGLLCKSIFSHVYFDIAFSKFGSFSNPQIKLVGALIQFGAPHDYFARCKNTLCEQIAKDSAIKLITEVNFVDVSKPAQRKFAQPPGLEAKLPHDFFYPFFAFNGSSSPKLALGWLFISLLRFVHQTFDQN